MPQPKHPSYIRAIHDCLRIVKNHNHHYQTPENAKPIIQNIITEIDNTLLHKKRMPYYIDWQGIALQLGYIDQKNMLVSMYQANSLTVIANYLGVSRSVLSYHFNKLGITLEANNFNSPRKPNILSLKTPPHHYII